MAEKILDLSNVINVTIEGTPSGLLTPNINTIALLTRDQPSGWAGGQEHAIYRSLGPVLTDFGSGSLTAQIATAFFSQAPNPLNSDGYFIIIPRNTGGTETCLNALIRMIGKVSFFGVLVDEEYHSAGATFIALSNYCQANEKMLFYASSDATDFAVDGLLDLRRQASQDKIRCLYFNDGTPADTQAFAAAYAARGMSTVFDGSRTTQTMNMKSLVGVVPDVTIDQTLKEAADAAGVDIYVSIAGVPVILSSGGNRFFDAVYNSMALKLVLQTAYFNFLRQTNTKIPQTEAGIEGLKNECRRVLDQFVSNEYLAPGSWTSPDVFGDPESLIRNIKDQGYYVYSLPVAKQLKADRDARIAPLIQIAAKEAGAVHKGNVIVSINP